MLTVEERRRAALRISRMPDASRYARVVAQAAVVAMQARFKRLSRVIPYAGDGVPCTQGPRWFSALVKPVGDACNLRCTYCVGLHNSAPQKMRLDVLGRIISQVLEILPHEVSFSFHGGEPLLAGLDFFEAVVAMQKKHARPGQRIRNSVQTNATLIDDTWGSFFAANGFGISVSLDGPECVHDAHRVDAEGRGTLARVRQGIGIAQSHGTNVGAIAVITCPPRMTPAELYSLMASLGMRFWRANPCRLPESASCYGQFVEGLLDAWVEADGVGGPEVISDLLNGALGCGPRTCTMAGSCAEIIGFEPDGTVKPCCELPIQPRFHFGNIRDSCLKDLLCGDDARRFWSLRDQRGGKCGACEWWPMCHGGCTFTRLQNGGRPDAEDPLCVLYKDLFSRGMARLDRALAEGLR
jgi:uncharacterized protein